MTGHANWLARGWRGRLWAALVLVLPLMWTAAGGVAAATGHLYNPSVSPRTAPEGSPVDFSVSFADVDGAAPQWVCVDLDGALLPMTATGSDYLAGVQYALSLRPAAGRHSVRFRSLDAGGSKQTAWGGYVTITAGPPSPPPATPPPNPTATPVTGTPAPTATPAPTLKPSAAPTAKPTPRPTSPPTPAPPPGAGSTTGPGSSPTPESAAPAATPSAAATALAPESGGSGGAGDGSGGVAGETAPGAGTGPVAAATPGPDGTAATGSTAGSSPDHEFATASGRLVSALLSGGTSGPGTDGAARPIAGSSTAAPSAPLGGAPTSWSEVIRALAPTIATTIAGVAAWAAFMMFGRRRRDDEDGDEPNELTLAVAAASAYEVEVPAGPQVVDEALMPRWRRPSLQAARRSDPSRAVAEAQRLSFDASGVSPVDNAERRQIRYTLVRLLDSPDELRSQEIGILERGDEVQLLQSYGAYWLVFCPDGRTGWVHRMTLADPAERSA